MPATGRSGTVRSEDGILDLCRGGLRVLEDLGCVVEEVVPKYPVERVWQNWLKLRALTVGATGGACTG